MGVSHVAVLKVIIGGSRGLLRFIVRVVGVSYGEDSVHRFEGAPRLEG